MAGWTTRARRYDAAHIFYAGLIKNGAPIETPLARGGRSKAAEFTSAFALSGPSRYAETVEEGNGFKPRANARSRLRELIQHERRRAQWHIDLIKKAEPYASKDRVAHLILERWRNVATVEGGLTGAFGFAGVPLNLLLFAYCQLAVVVSIAEAYGVALDGEAGEKALLDVLGKAHGIEDLVRASPRVLGALARALAIRHGLGTLGRLVPMVAAPISASLNRRELERTGMEALRRFGNVVMIG